MMEDVTPFPVENLISPPIDTHQSGRVEPVQIWSPGIVTLAEKVSDAYQALGRSDTTNISDKNYYLVTPEVWEQIMDALDETLQEFDDMNDVYDVLERWEG